jgi:hypothetical protein
MPKTEKSPLSIETVNTNVINAEYAVRGEIVQVRGHRSPVRPPNQY